MYQDHKERIWDVNFGLQDDFLRNHDASHLNGMMGSEILVSGRRTLKSRAHMNFSLNSLTVVILEDYIGDYYKGYQGGD